jgi:hypothetical protein
MEAKNFCIKARLLESLCFINGFKSEKDSRSKLLQKWYFHSENDIATFLYKNFAGGLELVKK